MDELEKAEIELHISRCETNIQELKLKILKSEKQNDIYRDSIEKQTIVLDKHKESLKE